MLKGVFIAKLLNNPLASCSLINPAQYRRLHILIKLSVFLYLVLQPLCSYYLFFLCTPNNSKTLFYSVRSDTLASRAKSEGRKKFLISFISSFISSYSFNTLITKTNSSWLIYESIKALEIKIFMLFELVFANNTTLSCFFFFFLIIDLWILIPAVIAQIFNPIIELATSIGIPSKEAKAKIS